MSGMARFQARRDQPSPSECGDGVETVGGVLRDRGEALELFGLTGSDVAAVGRYRGFGKCSTGSGLAIELEGDGDVAEFAVAIVADAADDVGAAVLFGSGIAHDFQTRGFIGRRREDEASEQRPGDVAGGEDADEGDEGCLHGSSWPISRHCQLFAIDSGEICESYPFLQWRPWRARSHKPTLWARGRGCTRPTRRTRRFGCRW